MIVALFWIYEKFLTPNFQKVPTKIQSASTLSDATSQKSERSEACLFYNDSHFLTFSQDGFQSERSEAFLFNARHYCIFFPGPWRRTSNRGGKLGIQISEWLAWRRKISNQHTKINGYGSELFWKRCNVSKFEQSLDRFYLNRSHCRVIDHSSVW